MEAWKTTYPTVADVNKADFATMSAWDKHLPAPQTDVERAVRKRISKRRFESAAKEYRDKKPEIADEWNRIMDKLEKITGAHGPRM